MQKILKIPKITLRKLCEEAWSSSQISYYFFRNCNEGTPHLSTTTGTKTRFKHFFFVQFGVSRKLYLVSTGRRVVTASRAAALRAETAALPPSGRPRPTPTGGTQGSPRFVNLYRFSDNDSILITYLSENQQLIRRYGPRIVVASSPTHRGSRVELPGRSATACDTGSPRPVEFPVF